MYTKINLIIETNIVGYNIKIDIRCIRMNGNHQKNFAYISEKNALLKKIINNLYPTKKFH